MSQIITFLSLSAEIKYSFLFFIFIKYLIVFIVLLCPWSDNIFLLSINVNISKLLLLILGDIIYSLLSLYDINISYISLNPYLILVFVISYLYFKFCCSLINL